MASPLRLRDLAPGERARLAGYPDESAYSQRLASMGLIAGTTLLVKRRAPLGDPVEVSFRGYSLILRPAEADCLELEPA